MAGTGLVHGICKVREVCDSWMSGCVGSCVASLTVIGQVSAGTARFYICVPLTLGIHASWALPLTYVALSAKRLDMLSIEGSKLIERVFMVPSFRTSQFINLDSVDVWVKKQAILYKIWAGLLGGMYPTTRCSSVYASVSLISR